MTLMELKRRAGELYPDNEALQRAWMRAILIVRNTSRGWCLDLPRTGA